MQEYSNHLLKAIVVLSLIAALSIHPLVPARAASNTRVYVLGVSNPTDPLILDLQGLTSSVVILNSIASLSTLSPSSILYIDGSWLASASSKDLTVMPAIVQTVLTGLPAVVVRGDPSILPNSISGLMKFDNPGLPLIAEGVHVAGTLTDGTKQGAVLRVLSGFDYAVAAEFQWASQQIPQSISLPILSPFSIEGRGSTAVTVTQAAAGPSWLLILQASTDTSDHFKPFGHVNTTFLIYELQNSGSNSSKWFDIFTNQTITPGAVAYGGSYRNYLETTTAQSNNRTTNIFVDNGPSSLMSSGPTTVNYSIGSIAGSSNATVTSTQSMTYFLKNVNIDNNSNSTNVGWVHTISGGTSAGKLTLQFIPGWTDEVGLNYALSVSGDLSTTFATFGNSMTPTNTASTDVPFAIFGG